MDAPGLVPASINCHACGTLIDLTGQTAFTQVECFHCGELSVVPVLFRNFLLFNVLGNGAIGTVYKAMDVGLNRPVALKILRRKLAANPAFIERFSNEARAAAAVNHPNIAQVYSFGEHEHRHYLAMELLEGGSLDDRIGRLGSLAEADVLEIGTQITAGLVAANERGFLHHDIKPGNILFNDEGVPKIVDFGLARTPDAAQLQAAASGPIWGTPYYIAPEKLRGQGEDFRSDIYSLGATLFHALAGHPPSEAVHSGEITRQRAPALATALRTRAAGIHDLTIRLILRMIASDPAERYGSYEELMRNFQKTKSALKRGDPTSIVVVKSAGRNWPLLIALGVVALLGLAILMWWR